MTGVVAVRTVLIANAALTALVPPARIGAGVLPQDTALPAISLTSVSKVDRNIPAPGNYRHVSERVQVTVLARNYPEQLAVMAAVRGAAADQVNPVVSGLTAVTIHTEGAGPDIFSAEASIYQGEQDFRVTYTEAR